MLEIVGCLIVLLPIAWLASEFQRRVELRIILGLLALLMSFGVAWVSQLVRSMDDNTYYGTQIRDLVQNTINELEAGQCELVLEALHELRAKYEPTYENRADLDKHIERYVTRISDQPVRHEPGMPGWSGQ